MAADDLAMKRATARESAVTVLTKFSWNTLTSTPEGLTYWGLDKMADILRTTFSNACSRMKLYENFD